MAAILKYHDSDDVMYPHCLQAMVEPLEAEPRAAFALSGSRSWPGGPCPMLLTPRLAYEREFLGAGLFQQGPASALFRAGVFRELGGFPAIDYAGDYLFWLRACATANVLLVPGDLFYYRVHSGQELAKPAQASPPMPAARPKPGGPELPGVPALTGEALERGKRNFVFTQARGICRHIRAGRVGAAAITGRHVGLSLGDWVSYLRRPRESRPPARRTTRGSGRDDLVRRCWPSTAASRSGRRACRCTNRGSTGANSRPCSTSWPAPTWRATAPKGASSSA